MFPSSEVEYCNGLAVSGVGMPEGGDVFAANSAIALVATSYSNIAFAAPLSEGSRVGSGSKGTFFEAILSLQAIHVAAGATAGAAAVGAGSAAADAALPN